MYFVTYYVDFTKVFFTFGVSYSFLVNMYLLL